MMAMNEHVCFVQGTVHESLGKLQMHLMQRFPTVPAQVVNEIVAMHGWNEDECIAHLMDATFNKGLISAGGGVRGSRYHPILLLRFVTKAVPVVVADLLSGLRHLKNAPHNSTMNFSSSQRSSLRDESLPHMLECACLS
jgi:hypothetical protein